MDDARKDDIQQVLKQGPEKPSAPIEPTLIGGEDDEIQEPTDGTNADGDGADPSS